MRVSQRGQWSSLEGGRHELSARLRGRLPKIEEAIFSRVGAVSRPASPDDPEYIAGLRATVRDVVDYALRGLEAGDGALPAVPTTALAQARRAARSGISLDTVLRRYYAGDRLLCEQIVGEAGDLPRESLQQVLRILGPLADHLTAVIAAEHTHELERMRRSPAQRMDKRIGRLLAGERENDPELGYEFEAWHLGMIVAGAGAEAVVRSLASQLDCQSLLSPRAEGDATWAWLGKRHRLSIAEIEHSLKGALPIGLSLALGEPRQGIEGWRLTHLEAQAALRVMLYKPERITKCRDVILVSGVMGDQTLAKSLISTFLTPLDGRGDYGEVLRETLRAYFAADQNAATTASMLGVARHTVERRLRSVEKKLEQTIGACSAQLQVALGMEELMVPSLPLKEVQPRV